MLAPVPQDLASDITLLTHELVTNAVKHADGGYVWVSALVLPELIRIEVSDEGGLTQPAVLPVEPFATSGRGLMWVDELADRWGTEQGRVNSVWFQIARDAGADVTGTAGRERSGDRPGRRSAPCDAR